LPVLAERSDLGSIEIGKEHASKFPALPSRAIPIRAGPFGNEEIARVERVRNCEVDVLLLSGGSCPVVVNSLATTDRFAEWIFLVADVASEEAGGETRIPGLPGLLIFLQEFFRDARVELCLLLWRGSSCGGSVFHDESPPGRRFMVSELKCGRGIAKSIPNNPRRPRHRLVQMRIRISNQLQAIALNEGVRRKKALWRAAGRTTGIAGRWHPGRVDGGMILLALLDQLAPKINELTTAIEKQVEQCPEAVRLMSHPGVGAITALAFVLIIGYPETDFALPQNLPEASISCTREPCVHSN
jgi:hypothetical protein